MLTPSPRMAIITWIVICSSISFVESSLAEARLVAHLLKWKEEALNGTDTVVRPVVDRHSPLNVEFALGLAQLADFSEERQTLDLLIWENMRWTDEFFRWDPADYDGIEVTLIPVEKIWIPDVIPYRIMDFISPQVAPYVAMVTYEGMVTFVPQRVYSIPCSVDVLFFPLDVHTCNLTYGSWSYSEDAINMTFYEGSNGIMSEQFVPNQKWNLLDLKLERKEVTFACCSGKYIMFEYSITIQRQVAFFAFVLILPAVMLTVLTLVAFCLPADCTEKINIGLNVFLSYFVLLVILVESSPAVGSTVPLLGQFFSLSLLLIALSVFCSAFVYNLKDMERQGRPFPSKYLGILLRLASVLFVDKTQLYMETENQLRLVANSDQSLCKERTYVSDADNKAKETEYCRVARLMSSGSLGEIEKPDSIRQRMSYCPEYVECADYQSAAAWVLLATIFDRIFLVVYVVINVVSGVLIYCIYA